MHIHILGICGTFMGSLAVLAKEQGLKVTGCDAGVYPPMSTQLEQQGIELIEGFDVAQLELGADLYVIGNAISRGNPLLEAILNQGLSYTSGPGLLAEHVLQDKWVLAVAGTHGKTTTSSMLAWILEYAGMAPGFLIGGVAQNFSVSARLGETPFFVIEADEYDSAFFDKRSKFIHYKPRTLIVNNMEFDHADIFADLAAIQTQFHHLIRTLPQNARLIYPAESNNIAQTLARGCWSEQQAFSLANDGIADITPLWQLLNADGSHFSLQLDGHQAEVKWGLSGEHNVCNGVAALLAARHVGVELEIGAEALSRFEGVKRRMEQLAQVGQVSVYDDFAHHPTAIATTLAGLRNKVGKQARIVALIEPRSNTMRMGVHEHALLASAEQADAVCWADFSALSGASGMAWLHAAVAEASDLHCLAQSSEAVVDFVLAQRNATEQALHIVIMSNGGFAGIHQQVISALA